jgi:hypothetical protein
LTKLTRILANILIISLMLLVHTTAVRAIPSLPSSVYGTVKVNNANVSEGTLIEAIIRDQAVASSFSQTYNGNSVYVLDIPGDNTDTAKLDGGKEGDTIQFKIGGLLANETGTWHSGTSVMVNLTGTSSMNLNTSQPTYTSEPSQTPIIIVQSTKSPTQTLSATMQTTLVQTITSNALIHPSETFQGATLTTITPTTSRTETPGPEIPASMVVVIIATTIMLAGVLLGFRIFSGRKNQE